jgi:quercetin dioxygenase-like cupin family protein
MIRKLLFVSAVAVAVTATAFAQPLGKSGTAKETPGPTESVMAKPPEIKWNPGPPSLPAGSEIAVLSGDPKAEGPFVMRLRLPAKYKIPPHWHPAHEHVTVIEGGFWLGHGETWNDKSLKELGPGGFAMMPPKHSHFVATKKKTVIQVHAWGPWAIHYINPADDPRTATATAAPAK